MLENYSKRDWQSNRHFKTEYLTSKDWEKPRGKSLKPLNIFVKGHYMWSTVKIQPQKYHVVLPNNFVVKNTHQKAQKLDSSLFILRLMHSCDYNLNFVKNKLKLIFITVGFMFQVLTKSFSLRYLPWNLSLL